jgi:hypothetical protein
VSFEGLPSVFEENFQNKHLNKIRFYLLILRDRYLEVIHKTQLNAGAEGDRDLQHKKNGVVQLRRSFYKISESKVFEIFVLFE